MFQELLERIALGLDKGRIPYMIIGGQALLVHGEPRLTRGIDITLGVDVDRFGDVQSVSRQLALEALPERPEEFARETKVLPCLDRASGIRVEFIFSFSPYESQAIQRAQPVAMGRAQVRFATPEDLVIHKIVAGRPRDLEDVRSVLLKNSQMDVAYVRKWLGEFEKALPQPFLKSFEQVLAETQS